MAKGEGRSQDGAVRVATSGESPATRNRRRYPMQLHDSANVQNSNLAVRASFSRRAVLVALAAALTATIILSLSGTVAASNDVGPRGCTLATLRGRYLFANA